MPRIAVVRKGNSNYLDLKSRDSSYGLERDTQHAGTSAESCFSEVAFRSAPQS
jgi:hypothetical protein